MSISRTSSSGALLSSIDSAIDVPVEPPSVSLLTSLTEGWITFAHRSIGRVVGSYHAKYLAGILIGAGCAGSFFAGAGLPLILAGAALLAVSTACSGTCVWQDIHLENADVLRRSWELAKHLGLTLLVASAGGMTMLSPSISLGMHGFQAVYAYLIAGFAVCNVLDKPWRVWCASDNNNDAPDLSKIDFLDCLKNNGPVYLTQSVTQSEVDFCPYPPEPLASLDEPALHKYFGITSIDSISINPSS